MGGEATRAVTGALLPGASTIIYGALGGPVLQMNILDVFLGKSLKVCYALPCICIPEMAFPSKACELIAHKSSSVNALRAKGLVSCASPPYALRSRSS